MFVFFFSLNKLTLEINCIKLKKFELVYHFVVVRASNIMDFPPLLLSLFLCETTTKAKTSAHFSAISMMFPFYFPVPHSFQRWFPYDTYNIWLKEKKKKHQQHSQIHIHTDEGGKITWPFSAILIVSCWAMMW